MAETDDKNVYDYLMNPRKDSYVRHSRKFILQPHQTIPKYYLFSNEDIESVIIAAVPGSGKSNTAVFAMMSHIEQNNYRQFNNKFVKSPITKKNVFDVIKKNATNIMVVGPWVTEVQVKKELLNRVEFGFIDENKLKKIRQLLLSPIASQRQEGEQIKRMLELKINKLIQFAGYQALFNLLFPGININKFGQNIGALIQEYEQGTLDVNKTFLESLRGGIVIVDEFQKLYSSVGLNTYGFAVAYLNKRAKEYNYKLMYLTGTIINTSLAEIPDIINIISEDKHFIRREEYCQTETILDTIVVWRLRKEYYEKTIDALKNRFFHYDPNPINQKPTLKTINAITKENPRFFITGGTLMNSINEKSLVNSNNEIIGESTTSSNIDDDSLSKNNSETINEQSSMKNIGGNSLMNSINEQPSLEITDDTTLMNSNNEQSLVKNNSGIIGESTTSSNINEQSSMNSNNEQSLMKDNSEIIGGNSISALVFPLIHLLPQEIHIGNRMLSSMILYAVETKGLQNGAYSTREWFDSSSDEDSESSINIHDAYIPEPSSFGKYGIYKYGDVLYGTFLSLNNIGQFSAIGYEMCKICLENSFNKEKTVVYHNKINSFGIKQYAAILQYNGFIKFGNSPAKDSLCKRCRKRYHDHSLPIQERLKMKICSNFLPLVYDLLTGDLTMAERENLNNSIYNHPTNLYGDSISVLFVSDVAYAGVNFLNTNNMLVLSRIPNISKWKQITARIVRTGSHMALPIEKRYAKIYTFIIESRDEFRSKEMSIGVKYYKKSEILNTDIEKYIGKLSKVAISQSFNNYKFNNEKEKAVANSLFRNDIRKSIDTIISRTMIDHNTSIWSLNKFIARLKDRELLVTHLDLSYCTDEFLKNIIINSERITLKKYTRREKDILLIVLNHQWRTVAETKFNNISFLKFSQLNARKNTFAKLITKVEEARGFINVAAALTELLTYSGKKMELIVEQPIVWKAMFEIGNEYYDDDEEHFIFNHHKPNRDINKVKGFYYGEKIVMKDGSMKTIPLNFINVKHSDKHPFVYKISSIGGQFYLNVKIVRKQEEVDDRRRTSTGVSCITMDHSEFQTYFPKIDRSIGKRPYCLELMFAICELQNKMKEKITYTPFEHQ